MNASLAVDAVLILPSPTSRAHRPEAARDVRRARALTRASKSCGAGATCSAIACERCGRSTRHRGDVCEPRACRVNNHRTITRLSFPAVSGRRARARSDDAVTMDADATAIPVAELRSDSSQSDASGSRRPAGGGDGAILSEYQLWPHGYVAVATLRASQRALQVLTVPHTFEALVAATGANAGHLQVALRTSTSISISPAPPPLPAAALAPALVAVPPNASLLAPH